MEAISAGLQDDLPTYMRDDVKWVETKNDGILLFKNVSFNVRESDNSEENKNEYEHNQDNIILDFEADKAKFEAGMKYFHVVENKFMTVISKNEDEKEGFTELTIKYDESEENTVVKATQLGDFIDCLPVKARVLVKSGNKLSINGTINLDDSIKTGLDKIFASIGQKISKFKVFHGKELLPKDAKLEQLYKSDQGLEFF